MYNQQEMGLCICLRIASNVSRWDNHDPFESRQNKLLAKTIFQTVVLYFAISSTDVKFLVEDKITYSRVCETTLQEFRTKYL